MNPNTPKTCLITGALGFLGRYAVAEFAEQGYRVVGVGREELGGAKVVGLSDYTPTELPSRAFEELLSALRPSVIVHTAGPASVVGSMDDPASDFVGTVSVLFALLDAVRMLSPESRVVIVSSAAVYGNPSSLPVAETATPAPVSPYGFHKEMAEDLLAEFSRVYGLKTCAARVFSAYGAGLRRQILWDVCEKAKAGSPVRLFGTGDETRDFVHAADVALALRIIVEGVELSGDVFNVASGRETSIRELATAVVASVAPSVTVEFSGRERAGDPLRWRADVGRIQALGFEPRVPLAQGIAEYAAWYLENGFDR